MKYDSIHQSFVGLQIVKNNILMRLYVPYACHYKPWLEFFNPIFRCSLYCREVSVTDNLCTELGNSSIFGPKICGL